ncbi:MAG: serine hydrolase domain-containing protein [Bacteroidota bacterium]
MQSSTFVKNVVVFSCLLFLLSCSTEPKEKTPTGPPKNPHFQAFLQTYLHQFDSLRQATQTPGASIAIVRDTKVVHLAGYGVKNSYSEDSVDVHTVFRIGSLSKGFAAVLAGQLVAQQRLKWTDKVRRFVPQFQLKDSAQTQRINLLHVLSQSTGLPYHAYTNLVEANVDIRTIAQEFRKVNLISKEGEIYAYQNAAFSLIEPILEEATEQNLTALFQKQLLDPLGMTATTTDYESLIGAGNLAFPHSNGENGWQPRKISQKYYNAIPAGGINASISDMAQWLLLLLGNRPDIVDPQTLETVFQPRINTNNQRRYFHDWPMVETSYYGLGWRILTNATDTLMYHGGYVNGYRGEILLHPKEKLGICVLANAPTELTNRAVPMFLEVLEGKRDSIRAWEGKRMR